MKIAAKTDIGNQRSENQDSYRAGRRADDAVWGVVCDGMGGARGGRMAATMAADVLQQVIESGIDTARTPQRMRELLVSAVEQANRSIYSKARGTPSLSGMGTTAVCVAVRGGLAQYIHVGDSRMYLFRNNRLTQLTRDHSIVQEMVEQGTLTEEEAQNHPRKNLITRALGVADGVTADLGEKEVSPRDILLLCSDGLSNFVGAQEMETVLTHTPFYEMPDALVQEALNNGGLDNITVLLIQIDAVEDNNG